MRRAAMRVLCLALAACAAARLVAGGRAAAVAGGAAGPFQDAPDYLPLLFV